MPARASKCVLLQTSGDKASQQRDVAAAIALAKEWEP